MWALWHFPVVVMLFIHAIFNPIPLTIVLLREGSPAAVLSNILLWVVVIYVKSRSDRQSSLSSP